LLTLHLVLDLQDLTPPQLTHALGGLYLAPIGLSGSRDRPCGSHRACEGRERTLFTYDGQCFIEHGGLLFERLVKLLLVVRDAHHALLLQRTHAIHLKFLQVLAQDLVLVVHHIDDAFVVRHLILQCLDLICQVLSV
jgi:hypothetical protein